MMYKIFIISFISFFSLVNGQTKYFDEFDREISKNDFESRKIKGQLLKVYNDSTKSAKILTTRKQFGNINTDSIIQKLNIKLQEKIDKNKPLVIVYHPGKDACNSSGSATPESSYFWLTEMQQRSKKYKNAEVIYIYKKNDNIKTIEKLKWYKDPDKIIENSFFLYHYPCSSYVILYKNKFISHFAEFSMTSVWSDLKKITK